MEKHYPIHSISFQFIAMLSCLLWLSGFMLSAWECVLVNLGHVYRKAQQWEAAIDCYTRALGLVPNQASTYSVLAFTHHLQVYLWKLWQLCGKVSQAQILTALLKNRNIYLTFALIKFVILAFTMRHHFCCWKWLFFSLMVYWASLLINAFIGMQGDLDEAIVYYHKCLAVRPEDSLAEELLTMALKEHCTQGFPDLDIA